MRITGGAWCGRRLRGPTRGMPLRPTPDAMRERVFAVLGRDVEDASVLDLYAGTGAVGLEALSRGAARAVFVERHPAAARLITANCASVGVAPPVARVLVRPAVRAVAELGRRGERFTLAWADPPFTDWVEGLDALVAAAGSVLEPGAWACLECPAEAEVEAPAGLAVVRDLRGGASRVVLLRVGE